MNPSDIVLRAREGLRRLGVELPATPDFVDDAAVDYGMPGKVYVRRSDLFDQKAADRWQAALRSDAGWVHFNCLLGENGSVVVSLRCGGAREPSQVPAVNVSVEALPMQIEND